MGGTKTHINDPSNPFCSECAGNEPKFTQMLLFVIVQLAFECANCVARPVIAPFWSYIFNPTYTRQTTNASTQHPFRNLRFPVRITDVEWFLGTAYPWLERRRTIKVMRFSLVAQIEGTYDTRYYGMKTVVRTIWLHTCIIFKRWSCYSGRAIQGDVLIKESF